MLQSHSDFQVDFPQVGSLCFRTKTAEPARIQRRNDDGTVLLERRRRRPDGSTAPIDGASANVTVTLAEIFPDAETAIHGSIRAAAKARRSRAAGGKAVL